MAKDEKDKAGDADNDAQQQGKSEKVVDKLEDAYLRAQRDTAQCRIDLERLDGQSARSIRLKKGDLKANEATMKRIRVPKPKKKMKKRK